MTWNGIKAEIPQVVPPLEDLVANQSLQQDSEDVHKLMVSFNDQASILSSLINTVNSGDLEFQMDRLRHTLHNLFGLNEAVSQYANTALKQAAQSIKMKQVAVERQAGTLNLKPMTILRGISRTNVL